MRVRIPTCAFGLAVALTLSGLSQAAAQSKTDTTKKKATSSKRIRVTKEVGGEVVRVDTVWRRDTVFITRRDTLTFTTTRVDTVVIRDTVRLEPTPIPMPTVSTGDVRMFRRGGFYWGLGGGTTIPRGNLDLGYVPGINVTMPFGWDSKNIPLGIRFDVAYHHANGTDVNDAAGNQILEGDDAKMLSANAGLKLGLPINIGRSTLQFYGLGGAGAHRITAFTSPGTGTMYAEKDFTKARTEWGWNAGGGISFGWARSELFLESRYFNVMTEGADTRFVPIVLGLTFR